MYNSHLIELTPQDTTVLVGFTYTQNNMAWNNNHHQTAQYQKLKRWARKNLPQHCNHCGTTTNLQLDHIQNIATGGQDTPNNIQWLCTTCHQQKTRQEQKHGKNKWKRKPEPHPGLK